MSTNDTTGPELSQMARLLFDSAANNWYLGIFLQIIAGGIGVAAGLLTLDNSSKFIFAFLGFVILTCAVVLRVISEGKHGRAETMRRQAAFTEGLGWPISETLISDWRVRAGKTIVDKVEATPRSADYYFSKKGIGPRKLLEMAIESAFYTRHLYVYLAKWIWILLCGSVILSLLVLAILPAKIVPDELSLQIAYTIFLILPIILTIDLFDSIVKLTGLKSSILEVETDMEKLSHEKRINSKDIIRLVSEYNCQIACGFPIHNWVFAQCHNEIDKFWAKRSKKLIK